MNKVIVLSGVSGSGKSTHAKKLALAHPPQYPFTIISADSFFTHDGVYTFDADKLGEAHATCFHEFVCAVADDDGCLIIVALTATMKRDDMTRDETSDARMTFAALAYAVGCAARVAGLSLDVAKDGIEIVWDVVDRDIAAGLLNLPKKVGE